MDRLAVDALLRSDVSATTRTTGLGLGFGLAVAEKPMTPKALVAAGAAASGTWTATGAAVVARLGAEAGAALAAEAGRANEATRPPEAAMTAEVLTAGCAALATMLDSSVTGLKRPGARWRPELCEATMDEPPAPTR